MAGEDRPYCAWLLRTQPCVFCEGPRPTEIHHHTGGSTVAPGERPSGKQLGGKRGKGQRAHDAFGMPAHIRCHAKFHTECEESGDDRRAWQDAQVARLREAYEADLAAKGDVATGSALPAPVPSSLDVFDVDVSAAAFCSAYSLGDQVEHDLRRLLSRAVKAGQEGRA